MLDLSERDLTLINDTLRLIFHDRRFEGLDLRSELGSPRDEYLGLLRRVQERLDLRAFGAVDDQELSSINDILCFIFGSRFEAVDFQHALIAPWDEYRGLLRRVQERLRLRSLEAFVDEEVVALWVEGIAFDGRRGRTVLNGHDFGYDLERVECDERPRVLIALRGDGRIPLPGVYAANTHRWSMGRAWESNAAPEGFPGPPFLLTNEAGCRLAFRGPVTFSPSPWARESITQLVSLGETIPVLGDHWFGVIRVDSIGRRRGYLEAFSREGARLTRGELAARWVGWDEEFGQIEL